MVEPGQQEDTEKPPRRPYVEMIGNDLFGLSTPDAVIGATKLSDVCERVTGRKDGGLTERLAPCRREFVDSLYVEEAHAITADTKVCYRKPCSHLHPGICGESLEFWAREVHGLFLKACKDWCAGSVIVVEATRFADAEPTVYSQFLMKAYQDTDCMVAIS